MNNMFRKAERKQVALKIGISAPSGAGKTYSSLLIAYGICKDWSKIAVIDLTERKNVKIYLLHHLRARARERVKSL